MTIFSVVTLLLVFALIGFIVYLVVTYIPMPEPFKQVIIVLVVIMLILYVLTAVIGTGSSIRIK